MTKTQLINTLSKVKREDYGRWRQNQLADEIVVINEMMTKGELLQMFKAIIGRPAGGVWSKDQLIDGINGVVDTTQKVRLVKALMTYENGLWKNMSIAQLQRTLDLH